MIGWRGAAIGAAVLALLAANTCAAAIALFDAINERVR